MCTGLDETIEALLYSPMTKNNLVMKYQSFDLISMISS